MPTHWHFVLWPERDGEMTAFLRWLTMTHAVRWHTHSRSLGSGHWYQGRYQSFPVETDDHRYTLLRYVERNPLRANLVARAEDWRWSSLGLRPADSQGRIEVLSAWPVPRPDGWGEHVNAPQTEAELTAIRHGVARGCPYGSAPWSKAIAGQLGLEHTLRQRGRPRKAPAPARDLFGEE